MDVNALICNLQNRAYEWAINHNYGIICEDETFCSDMALLEHYLMVQANPNCGVVLPELPNLESVTNTTTEMFECTVTITDLTPLKVCVTPTISIKQ